MSESSTSTQSTDNAEAPAHPVEPVTPWARIKEHKVLQWSLAYLGAALALAHGQELLAHTYHWPELVGRVLMGVLIVGFPISSALAWYHGHRGMTRLSAGEMTVVSLLLVIGAGLLIALVRVPAKDSASAASAEPAAPAASVAVVPFANLTGETGKEYFSDGMAEELINELTKVPGLKVPARTSSFAYKGRNIDIRQIARDLGVATILEGSVRSAGERIRVTAQLVNAQTGYHIWSNTYEGNFGDVFKVQDDISAEIVGALRSSLNAQLPAFNTQAAPTSDPEAYRLYLQARSASSSTSYEVALRLATQATMRDPNFARAWAYKALIRASAAAQGAISAANAMLDAEHDADQALALNPNLSEAQTALAVVNVWRGNLVAAESSFRRAQQLAPDDATPRSYRAIILWASVGHRRQALEDMQEAYALAPASAGVISGLALMYAESGQYGPAVKYAELADELGGGAGLNFITLVRSEVAARSGQCVEGGELILPKLPDALRSPAGISTVRQVFAAFCAPTNRSAASRALTVLLRQLKPGALGPQAPMQIIVWYAWLGDLDAAFNFANRAVDEYARSVNVVLSWATLWIPEMRLFRKDPRFQQFLTRLKLTDYWKQYGPPDDCDLVGEGLVCR
jgi:TolB-like protein/Flp pilus assembly protein TadD